MKAKPVSTQYIVLAALIAALYTALTLSLPLLSFGIIQFRVSEALTVLPFYCPAAIPGVFIGCLISNLVGGGGLPDILFGSLATLIAALLTAKAKNHWLAIAPPIVVNILIIGPVLTYIYERDVFWSSLPFTMLSVGAGQLLACGGLGYLLLKICGRFPFFTREKEADK